MYRVRRTNYWGTYALVPPVSAPIWLPASINAYQKVPIKMFSRSFKVIFTTVPYSKTKNQRTAGFLPGFTRQHIKLLTDMPSPVTKIHVSRLLCVSVKFTDGSFDMTRAKRFIIREFFNKYHRREKIAAFRWLNIHRPLCNNLPPSSAASQHYNLRQCRHNLELPNKTAHLTHNNFIQRMLYLDSYWHRL